MKSLLIAGALLIAASASNATKEPIDVEVLASVVSAKQAELKDALIQRIILKNLGDTATTNSDYIHVRNIISIILNASDANTMQFDLAKEILPLAFELGVAKDSILAKAAVELAYEAFFPDSNKDISGSEKIKQLSSHYGSPGFAANIDRAALIGAVKNVWRVVDSAKAVDVEKRLGKEGRWIVNQVINSIEFDRNSGAKLNSISLLAAFQARYSGRANKYFEPIFTVGLNYGFSNHFDTDSLNGYASEKIGLKFKFWGCNFKYNRTEDASKIYREDHWYVSSSINDIHALAFVSGLLYNITPLPNYPSPNSLLFGGGLGLTFVNGLDLNVYAAHGSKNGSSWIYGLGWDVEIGEYLSALKKK